VRETPDPAVAAGAIQDGGLVVYPTETVYGLGADALDADAISGVFDAKRRDRDKPVSMAVPTVEAALEYTHPTASERAFMHEFLPGPVTVVLERAPAVPDVLTAGRDRVGVRVPDCKLALALLDETEPLTATSANVSGRESARRVADLDPEVCEATAVALDTGETAGGTPSTVVDVAGAQVHRRGAAVTDVEDWLDAH
jgi:translation factor SUA5